MTKKLLMNPFSPIDFLRGFLAKIIDRDQGFLPFSLEEEEGKLGEGTVQWPSRSM